MSPTDSHIDVREHPEAVELELEAGMSPAGPTRTSSRQPILPTHYIDDYPNLPRRMPNHLPRPKFVDPEGSISSKYLNIVEKEDNHIFESVSDTTDKTVIFVSL
jgi:hypothetical protein